MITVATSSKQADYQVSIYDSGVYFHNTGATGNVVFALPQAPYAGLAYTFTVASPQYLVIQAAGGAILALGSGTSSRNGTLQSQKFGSSITLYCKLVNGLPYWFAQSFTGTWQLN